MHNRKEQRGYVVLKWYGVDTFEIMQDTLMLDEQHDEVRRRKYSGE